VVTVGDVKIRFDRSFQYFTESLRPEGLVELTELVQGRHNVRVTTKTKDKLHAWIEALLTFNTGDSGLLPLV
jgi:hypothetical protein